MRRCSVMLAHLVVLLLTIDASSSLVLAEKEGDTLTTVQLAKNLTPEANAVISVDDLAASNTFYYKVDSDGILHDKSTSSVMVPHRRRKKRWIFQVITAVLWVANEYIAYRGRVMSRKMAAQAVANYRESMRLDLQMVCIGLCITPWSEWGACNAPCGGGTKKRTRGAVIPNVCASLEDFNCPFDSFEQDTYCNTACVNGAVPQGGWCECRPGWDNRCCTNEVYCDTPDWPDHGDILATWPLRYRSFIRFECDHGFYLDGPEELRCITGMVWNELPPTCKLVVCPEPQQQSHVQILNLLATYLVDDVILYACDDGYTLIGPETRTCSMFNKFDSEGTWTSFDPLCKEVSCDDPGEPIFGTRTGWDFTLNSIVEFQCEEGYKLIGSSSLRCMPTGKWLGNFPSCEAILCPPPPVPEHGQVRIRRDGANIEAVYSCDDGYVVDGLEILHCTENGDWDDWEPTCEPRFCTDPGAIDNGVVDGSRYYFPFSISITCHRGYQLMGEPTIACLETGVWAAPTATCQPCPLDTYIGLNNTCISCPDYTYTATTASTSQRQCICNHGYKGPPGGPCMEVECVPLSAPEDGSMLPCDNQLGSQCLFGCNDGYILEQGATTRTCQETETWDGQAPVCKECSVNTYKSDDRSCMPCPVHMNTNGEVAVANIQGCICDPGYQGPDGGPCTDFDDCLENNGRGQCEDVCENRDGGYTCYCQRPGYKVDPENSHACQVEYECRNLTEPDAPLNGGLICHWYWQHSSQQCTKRCNPGYEFPARTNDYETCGPTTGFIWSFKSADPQAIIEPCIEEFFPGVRLEADSSYFVQACNDLTEEERTEAMQYFASRLNLNGVCQREEDGGDTCNIENMAIICGASTRRRKRRGIWEEVSSVNFVFNVTALEFREEVKDCDQICSFLEIPERFCDSLCLPSYKNYLRAAVLYAKSRLDTLFSEERATMRMELVNRQFEPESISTSDVITACKPGMAPTEAACVPCAPGSYYSAANNSCVLCPVGSFQLIPGQAECESCPPGSSTPQPGALFCTACPDGYYGDRCSQQCDCVHGHCNPWEGMCDCDPGWQGAICDEDIPSCQNVTCFPGVSCYDRPAPAVGYLCGNCPAGYSGDGATCTRLANQ